MIRLAGIGDDQRKVCARYCRERSFDAELFHRIASRPQTGGVDDVQRNTANLDAAADRVARGSRHRCHDRDVFADETIEEARLADVGLSDQHDAEPFAQQASLAGPAEDRSEPLAERGELARRIRSANELDIFIGKIERGFAEHSQLDQCIDGGVDLA